MAKAGHEGIGAEAFPEASENPRNRIQLVRLGSDQTSPFIAELQQGFWLHAKPLSQQLGNCDAAARADFGFHSSTMALLYAPRYPRGGRRA